MIRVASPQRSERAEVTSVAVRPRGNYRSYIQGPAARRLAGYEAVRDSMSTGLFGS